jgi:hypothetical protein
MIPQGVGSTLDAGTVEVFYNPDSFAADVNGKYIFSRDQSGTLM